jgi:hypothetical protein
VLLDRKATDSMASAAVATTLSPALALSITQFVEHAIVEEIVISEKMRHVTCRVAYVVKSTNGGYQLQMTPHYV